MTAQFDIISPGSGQKYTSVPLLSESEALSKLQAADTAFKTWKQTTLQDRVAVLTKFVDALCADKDEIALELSHLMGRPLKQNYNEVRGFEERARHLISIAPKALAPLQVDDKPCFKRSIVKEALGVVLIIGAWNYPYLVTVNALIPALLAGNTVLLKHAPQTFPCADRYAKAFAAAGLPSGVFQTLPIDIPVAETIITDSRVSYIQFTGSVSSGRKVSELASKSKKFIHVGLELGGNDSAYVRSDADPVSAAENLVDGAMYNSGQSCCGIQRIYVHQSLMDQFVKTAVSEVMKYKLRDPLDPEANLGPVVDVASANRVRADIQDALSKGAQGLIDASAFPLAKDNTAFVAPQLLVSVNTSMKIVSDEVFGPVACIVPVKSDSEAVSLMNESPFGLTASLWTKDVGVADALARELEVGTVFLNRCDYLDPSLVWTGTKASGRGYALSDKGFEAFVRLKSLHFRLP